jgi:hypothetical protein
MRSMKYSKQQMDKLWSVEFRKVFTNGRGWKVRTVCLRDGIEFDGTVKRYNRKRSVVYGWKRGAFRTSIEGASVLTASFPGYSVLGMGVEP